MQSLEDPLLPDAAPISCLRGSLNAVQVLSEIILRTVSLHSSTVFEPFPDETAPSVEQRQRPQSLNPCLPHLSLNGPSSFRQLPFFSTDGSMFHTT